MKLLQQTGRYFLLFSLLVFVLGGTALFFGLDYMLDQEADENLYNNRLVLYKELSQRDSLPAFLEIMDKVIELQEVSHLTDQEIFKDTLRMIEEDGEKELEVFRQYLYYENIKGKNYRISLLHSKFEKEELLVAIVGLLLGLLFLFLIVVNLFNRYLSVRIWQPFYKIVEQVEQFNITQNTSYQSVPSDIEEFKTLDQSLQKMTQQSSQDYHSLKQFTENAAHEMQTPLAVIQSQIELLSQKEQEEKTMQQLFQIQQSTIKLSKLNQALLLLTRIENRQFSTLEKLNLETVIQQKLATLNLLIENKKISQSIHTKAVWIAANPLLIDMLISNLLSNAIKHNVIGGQIELLLTDQQLQIRNTAPALTIAPEKLFDRFRKADDSSPSIGLGLAIVKEICQVYNWRIDYLNEGDWHSLDIHF